MTEIDMNNVQPLQPAFTQEQRQAVADKLNGRGYPFDLTKEEKAEAKASGWVVVFGASDDLMEFRGAIDDEIGCYDGGTAYLGFEGLLKNACDDDDCPYFAQLQKMAVTIKALWDTDGYSWTYKTDIAHAEFDVLEDGEPYCRGIVFHMTDLIMACIGKNAQQAFAQQAKS